MSDEKRDWKLIRCIYDEMGMNCNEIEDPERFAAKVQSKKHISWCIATLIDFQGKKIARIELEGSKENLEYVLELVRKVI